MSEKEKAITIKKSNLWKYLTFFLIAVVIIGGLLVFSGPRSGTGSSVVPTGPTQGQSALSFSQIASQVGIENPEFDSCVASGEFNSKARETTQYGQGIGVRGTPAFFINGNPISGACPYSVFEQAINAELNGQEWSVVNCQFSSNPPIGGRVGVEIGDSPILGDPNAPVQIVDFSDYYCSFCQRHSLQTKPLIKSNFLDSGEVSYVMVNFLGVAPGPGAANAALCARKVGGNEAFWEMNDALYQIGPQGLPR